MTLDPELLTAARAARLRMVDAQHELEHARSDFHHAVGRLHAAGASMREIASELDLSHQRVHQIVSGGDDVVGPVQLPLIGPPPHGPGDRFLFKRIVREEDAD
jgi:hypothetical protein